MTLTNDIGQVKIYFGYETDNYSFPFPDFSLSESKVLYGNKRDSGLFGYSLNSEGDLNFDDYKDLVVGAPYEDEGRGAVYIFNGGSEFFDTHSQVCDEIYETLAKHSLNSETWHRADSVYIQPVIHIHNPLSSWYLFYLWESVLAVIL